MNYKDLYKRIENLSFKQRELLKKNLSDNLERKNNTQDTSLKILAYVIYEPTSENFELKKYLEEKLPDYMIPNQIIPMVDFPLLPNGKINLNALPTSIENQTSPAKSLPNPLEEKLITIWEKVLNYSPAKVEDNFFEVGGDSILSIQIIAKARKEGIILTPNQLFEQPTIRELLGSIGSIPIIEKKEGKEKNEKNEEIQLSYELINVWEEVLNYSPAKLEDNFFEVGGDSILSIQLVAKARKLGIIFTPDQLFEYPILFDLINNLKDGKKEIVNNDTNSQDELTSEFTEMNLSQSDLNQIMKDIE